MKKIFLPSLFFITVLQTTAQPFINDIRKFRQQDSIQMPALGQTLFIGSSSFTLWKDVQDYFPEHKILNRAFGGSTLENLVFYINDIAYPYKPRQVVIYCGENDFAGDTSLSPGQVFDRFTTLFKLIRKKYKKVPVAYVSMKPSPSRKHLLPKFSETNGLIKKFLRKKKRTGYIDAYNAMLNADGSIKGEIFLKDDLHMNEKGYRIWAPLIQEKLK